MELDGYVQGGIGDQRTPYWPPLLDLAPDLVGDFMWMGIVDLEDGRRLQAYKHYWTRRYLHLDDEGTAFVYTPYGYLRGNADWELEMARHDTVGKRY